ncbi:MAG TPA: sigma-70 family RNA polymerase sigma factor, partial [Terriglobales bacterium]|nr:sigma-70 family RNA polymerase sigma factor [Terriglobales bacterium]
MAAVFRDEAGRLTAGLVRLLGDFDVAEEIVQDTLLLALERWRRDGIPDRPGAWLTTAARRRAIDRLRRDARFRQKLALLEAEPANDDEPDDRLRLIFTCCHPALSPRARVVLTLRAVCGFTTAEIAGAFLLSEAAVSQQIHRARRKIVQAGIPYRVPGPGELADRLDAVLAVLYLMFNEGYLSRGGGDPARRDLAEDAAWLATLLTRLLPAEPEPLGLLALMRLHLARAATRFDAAGDLVLIADQDRSGWDHEGIAAAIRLVERAGAMRRPGPYQLQAAIAACHAEAPSWAATDWRQIVVLYDLLLRLTPSPVVRLNRAVALRWVAGSRAALAEVDALAGALDGYHLFHAARAELLQELGRGEE